MCVCVSGGWEVAAQDRGQYKSDLNLRNGAGAAPPGRVETVQQKLPDVADFFLVIRRARCSFASVRAMS